MRIDEEIYKNRDRENGREREREEKRNQWAQTKFVPEAITSQSQVRIYYFYETFNKYHDL